MSLAIETVEEIKSRITEIGPIEARQLLDQAQNGTKVVLLDVREQHEWDQSHIEGAVLVSQGKLGLKIESVVPGRDTKVIIYCAVGRRSARAADIMQRELGYTDVASLSGGIKLWSISGNPTVQQFTLLTPQQKERYSRHLLVPEIGIKGQEKLLQSKVLLIGAGGLGSPAALYLAAAGVGTLGLVDDDLVDATNLQRQVAHTNDRVGEHKVDSATKTIESLNPDVKVIGHKLRLTSENVEETIKDYDVIVDGADNFPTRYLLNDAAVKLGKPVVHASILAFDGQVTVFAPKEGPCYRCLYPTPPPADLAPSCADNGVLGVLPGIMGLLQSNEVVKLIVGYGEPLIGRLLLFEALATQFTELKVRRDPNCLVCGDEAGEIDLSAVDYEAFCSI